MKESRVGSALSLSIINVHMLDDTFSEGPDKSEAFGLSHCLQLVSLVRLFYLLCFLIHLFLLFKTICPTPPFFAIFFCLFFLLLSLRLCSPIHCSNNDSFQNNLFFHIATKLNKHISLCQSFSPYVFFFLSFFVFLIKTKFPLTFPIKSLKVSFILIYQYTLM